VVYHGLEVLGSGAILVSLILAAITAFMIDREFFKAAGFAAAGAVLTFFGFMHSEAIGIAKMPMVALSYVAVAVTLLACAKYAVVPAPRKTAEGGHAASAEGMEHVA